MSGAQQAGYAEMGSTSGRAGLWSGSAASWVDLSPLGSTDSEVWATNGFQQAGFAYIAGKYRASFWDGTAASWVDLHSLLPAEFVYSYAMGISSDGTNVYVSGYGVRAVTSQFEALLWTHPIPEPSSIALLGLGALLISRCRRR